MKHKVFNLGESFEDFANVMLSHLRKEMVGPIEYSNPSVVHELGQSGDDHAILLKSIFERLRVNISPLYQ